MVLVLWGSAGEEECRALRLKEAHPSATGGHLTSSCQARTRGTRVRDTDEKETPTSRGIDILQWNAEGAHKKTIALTVKLHKENIDVACLQETHLKENQRFTMRGCQVVPA